MLVSEKSGFARGFMVSDTRHCCGIQLARSGLSDPQERKALGTTQLNRVSMQHFENMLQSLT